MKENIKSTIRKRTGTGNSRRLRHENKIPAIVYGNNVTPINIIVDHKDIFYALQKENFHTSILNLCVDEKEYNVIVRDFQMHPFKQLVQHIDFQIINQDEKIKMKVPLHLINEEISPVVKLHGSRITKLYNNIEILSLPKDIPEYLEIDVKDMTIGQIYHMSDVKFPTNVESIAIKKGQNPVVVNVTKK